MGVLKNAVVFPVQLNRFPRGWQSRFEDLRPNDSCFEYSPGPCETVRLSIGGTKMDACEQAAQRRSEVVKDPEHRVECSHQSTRCANTIHARVENFRFRSGPPLTEASDDKRE